MSRLSSTTALITGGSSGIGLAIARAFLGEGAKIAITARREDRLREASRSLNAGERVFTHPADVSDPAQVTALVAAATARLGPIHVLVNNAGLNIKERRTRELTPDRWRLLLQANLDGAFFCTHAVLPYMLARKDGLIIFIDSTAGKRPTPLGGAAYAASKFGMRGFALCLAAEEEKNGLRVSVIYPGEVDTPILDARPHPVPDDHRRRILQPDDVAAAAFFVATLPPRVSVPELVIKPTTQVYV